MTAWDVLRGGVNYVYVFCMVSSCFWRLPFGICLGWGGKFPPLPQLYLFKVIWITLRGLPLLCFAMVLFVLLRFCLVQLFWWLGGGKFPPPHNYNPSHPDTHPRPHPHPHTHPHTLTNAHTHTHPHPDPHPPTPTNTHTHTRTHTHTPRIDDCLRCVTWWHPLVSWFWNGFIMILTSATCSLLQMRG